LSEAGEKAEAPNNNSIWFPKKPPSEKMVYITNKIGPDFYDSIFIHIKLISGEKQGSSQEVRHQIRQALH
jgi:hypothetical protein